MGWEIVPVAPFSNGPRIAPIGQVVVLVLCWVARGGRRCTAEGGAAAAAVALTLPALAEPLKASAGRCPIAW